MKKIKIEDKEFEVDELSEVARDTLASLRFAEAEIVRAQATLAAMQTARAAYARALRDEVINKGSKENETDDAVNIESYGDTIKFD